MKAPAPSEGRVEIHASRFKHGLVALACFYVALLGWKVLQQPGETTTLGVAMIVTGIVCGIGMAMIGFSPKPVLVIDGEGITCRRPNFGHLPWSAITGIGLGRASFHRTALIIAYDKAALGPEHAEQLRREVGSLLMSPELMRYRGEMAGYPTVQISIAMLGIRPAEMHRILEQQVSYHGEET